MKYACIHLHRAQFPVGLMCRVLEVSRSGYYAWNARTESARAQADRRLQRQIGEIFGRSRARYGSPRIHAELRAQGVRCGKKRVARLMRQQGWAAGRGRIRPRGVVAADRPQPLVPASNLLQRRFALAVQPPGVQTWVSDLTYLPTEAGWLYLAVVLELHSRRVLGWAMHPRPDAALVCRALDMAWAQNRHRADGVLHHSDQGVQYTSRAYQERLARHQIQVSMSRRGNCWDNAVAESFFATLEKELVQGSHWATHAEARAAVFEFIEIWYNRQRRHSTLGYCTPAEYEARRTQETRAA